MLKGKKHYIVSIMVAAILLSGFGCSGLTAKQQAAMAPVNLEYWTVFDDPTELRALINTYRADHPYLSVNLVQLRPEEVYPKLIETLAEDKGPDIISIRNRSVGQFVSKLTPLPASVKDTTVVVTPGRFSNTTVVTAHTLSLPTVADIDHDYVQVVKKDAVVNDKIYGLPLSLDTMALYYNKDLLDRAGVAEPPTNWQDFQVAVKKIAKYDKTSNKILQAGAALGVGTNVPGSDDLLYILLKQSGVDMMSKSGQAVFNYGGGQGAESPTMAVMNFYTDFANPTRDTYTWNDSQSNALDAFVNGSLGFFFGYSYHNQIIKTRAPQLNFGVVPLLQLNPEQPVNVANYWLQSVVAKSKHQDEAWGLVDWLTHTSAAKEYLDKTNRPTALRRYIKDQKTNLDLQPFVNDALIAENWYRGKNYDAAVRAINDLLADWLVPPADPNKLVESRQNALNRAAARINQTMQ